MRPWGLKILALCPEHSKRDQYPKFTPLSETTSIPVCFIWESPLPPFPGFLHVSQVLELDLQTLYHCNCGTYSFVQKMMVLPFLPANGICTMFKCLQGQASEPLAEFSKYASSTWINGTTWTPPIGLPLSKLCTQTAKSNLTMP